MQKLRPLLQAALLAPIVLAALDTGTGAQGAPEAATWRLQRGQEISSAQASMPELTIQGQVLSGSTGCNSFTATLSRRSDGRVAIAQPAMTRKLCGPKQQSVENAFIAALGRTAFIEEDDKRLTFLSEAREQLLVWQPRRNAAQARATQRPIVARSRKRGRAEMAKSRRHASLARSELRKSKRPGPRGRWLVEPSCFIFH